MPKTRSRKTLIKNLDKIFSEYIRKRYANKNGFTNCVTCGKKDHWKNLQCGHFISRKQLATRFDELNCQTQCVGCNVFKYGEQYKFSLFLNAHYGENTAEELYNKSKKITRLTNVELLDKIQYYKEKVAQLDIK